MSYSVYWMNERFQGYGVPAYCDCNGCKTKIDRGLGYQHEEDKDNMYPSIFVCNKHQNKKLSKIKVDYTREHTEWLTHVLNDESWAEWRKDNPELVKKYDKKLKRRFFNDIFKIM